jgi:hypothetical protein
MELGPFHLQLIMSVTLILTAAIVAFICDVLQRNNEQLRAMNMELQIRQEEEQKRWAIPAPRITQPVAHVAVRKEALRKDRSAVSKEKKRLVNPEALAAMERGATLARSAPAPQPAIKKDWENLLNRNAQAAKPAGTLPAGFADGHILSKLIQSREPVSGLVVSIGVNAASTEKLPGDVRTLVESLIGPNDFAAQSCEDEFLLIYPDEHGASAQRRLSQIARQLWDFQLRSLGSVEILFSWGGVEVQSESIEEAIASASDRMQETKRGRKLPSTIPSHDPHITHLESCA